MRFLSQHCPQKILPLGGRALRVENSREHAGRKPEPYAAVVAAIEESELDVTVHAVWGLFISEPAGLGDAIQSCAERAFHLTEKHWLRMFEPSSRASMTHMTSDLHSRLTIADPNQGHGLIEITERFSQSQVVAVCPS